MTPPDLAAIRSRMYALEPPDQAQEDVHALLAYIDALRADHAATVERLEAELEAIKVERARGWHVFPGQGPELRDKPWSAEEIAEIRENVNRYIEGTYESRFMATLAERDAEVARLREALIEAATVLDTAAANAAGQMNAEPADPLTYGVLTSARDQAFAALNDTPPETPCPAAK